MKIRIFFSQYCNNFNFLNGWITVWIIGTFVFSTTFSVSCYDNCTIWVNNKCFKFVHLMLSCRVRQTTQIVIHVSLLLLRGASSPAKRSSSQPLSTQLHSKSGRFVWTVPLFIRFHLCVLFCTIILLMALQLQPCSFCRCQFDGIIQIFICFCVPSLQILTAK